MPNRLPRLTSLRAVAALYVFAFHLRAAANMPLHNVTVDGFTGVSFFFVLSGFVLTWAWKPGAEAKRFYRNRIARIYPCYVVTLVIAAFYPGNLIRLGGANTTAYLLMVQTWSSLRRFQFAGDPVAWTLSCEAFFYLLFPLLVVRLSGNLGRCWTIVGAYWVLCSYVVSGKLEDHHPFLSQLPPARLGEFLVGIAAALTVRAGRSPQVPVPLAWALLVEAAVVSNYLHSDYPTVLLTPCYLLLIVASAQADIEHRPGLLTSGPAIYAGSISFAFYLVHELVMANTSRYFGIHQSINIATIFELCVISAMLLHHLIERPAERLIRGDRRKVPLPSEKSATFLA